MMILKTSLFIALATVVSAIPSYPNRSSVTGASGSSLGENHDDGRPEGHPLGHQFCMTKMGSKKALYSTCWETKSTAWTSTVSETSTTTLPAVTDTQVLTTTVTESITTTDTVSLTLTNTQVITTTETQTATATTTKSVSASTSTVPTSAGFIPIQTSLPGSTYGGSDGTVPVAQRDILDIDMRLKGPDTGKPHKKLNLAGKSKKLYPQEVQCYDHRPGRCTTSTTTIIRTESPTVTVMNTQTQTTTSYLGATTTVTITTSTSVTSTETTTTTKTETDTIYGTSTTVYAACATNNLADTYNCQPIGNAYYGQISSLSLVSTGSAYDCCVVAILSGTAGGFFWLPAYNGSPNQCAVFTPTTCATKQSSDIYQIGTGDQGIGRDTAGNAYCAQYNGVL